MNWAIDDRVGAWVPHGRFVIEGAGQRAVAGLRFAAKDVFDVAGHPTGAGNPPGWRRSRAGGAARRAWSTTCCTPARR